MTLYALVDVDLHLLGPPEAVKVDLDFHVEETDVSLYKLFVNYLFIFPITFINKNNHF